MLVRMSKYTLTAQPHIIKIVSYGLLLLACLALIFTLYTQFLSPSEVQYTVTETADDFTVTASYVGGDKWLYKVSGQIPNQCIHHDVTHDTNEDSVAMTLFLYRADDESLCAKRPDVIVSEGSFTADKNTKLTFSVNEEVQPGSPTGLKPKS